jgi:hypothetical protein
MNASRKYQELKNVLLFFVKLVTSCIGLDSVVAMTLFSGHNPNWMTLGQED